MKEISSYSHPDTNQKVLEIIKDDNIINKKILDVGAGEGYFTSLLGEYLKEKYSISPSQIIRACDLYPENFKYREVICDKIDVNRNFPYEDNLFDIVCCIEVIEHIEDQFHLIRELYRITKPDGKVIVTTPNVLNINSRIRSFYSGFGLLYNPLPLSFENPVHQEAGHIHPIAFYYLGWIFYHSGFKKINLHFDRKKKSAIIWTALLYLIILLGDFIFKLNLKKKNKNIYRENKGLLDRINRLDMLISRTIIIEGIK